MGTKIFKFLRLALALGQIAWKIRTVIQMVRRMRASQNGFSKAALVLFAGDAIFLTGVVLGVLAFRKIGLIASSAGMFMVDYYLFWPGRQHEG